MDRVRAWLVVGPLVAAGTLVAHVSAYRLTGTAETSLHSYLEHAPQVVLLVSVLAIALAGLGARLEAPPAWSFAALAPAAFLAQEHLERVVHAGEAPWVLTTPAVLVGLVLQVPLALVVWLVARRLLVALAPGRVPRAQLPRAFSDLSAPADRRLVAGRVLALSGRGPPPLLRR